MNHLANETSPYLLQHASNPVDWYPWGEEALAKARVENKPILLSIGYSACHWCHVMAHESFEDEGTAELMNRLYVNIKVDREERPDLDKIYQNAHYLLTRHGGGWPLTVFLTPDDLTPFFAGTYFPRNARYGLLPFCEILLRIADAYQMQQAEIKEQNVLLQQALAQMSELSPANKSDLNLLPLQQAITQIIPLFDKKNGGFSKAPKFPHTDTIERLLQYGWQEKDESILHMAMFTLEKMALGGIYDQLGGGFSRYSVDKEWMIPHFEKMLYDNALLLNVYIDAFTIDNNPLFQKIIKQTADWVLKEMQSHEGGYYSAIDADSEGEEGRYYIWEKDEVKQVLTDEEYEIFAKYYGINQPANFEEKWHLFIARDLSLIAKENSINFDNAQLLIQKASKKLLDLRDQRIPPTRDEKILTSWNGLMIKAMAKAGWLLKEPVFIESAQKAVDFIYRNMWKNQRLLATYKDGRAHLMAYLDDYAFLLEGLLNLLQINWRAQDLQFAIEIAEAMLNNFWDQEKGGFFFTAHHHEKLLQRLKLWTDEALPAGNGVAAFALGRLGYLLGEKRYLDAAEGTIKAGWSSITSAAYAHHSLLRALEDYVKSPQIIILRGERNELDKWKNMALNIYKPRCFLVAISADEKNLPTNLQNYKNHANVTAYICENFQCSSPITDINIFKELVKK